MAARTAMVVDDEIVVRRLVRTVLEADDFTVIEASGGQEALALLADTPLSIVILDVMMPELDGVEVCRRIDHSSVKVVMLTARDDPDVERRCRDAGAVAFLTKPFSSIELLELLEGLGAWSVEPGVGPTREEFDALERQGHVLARDAVSAYRNEKARASELEQALATLQTAFLETIRSMAFVVEAKDAYTGQHLERCRVYGMALMSALGISSEYPDAQYGFLLHDSGKIGVPESILCKPGPLTAAEWRVMRTHPLIGYQMLSEIPFLTNAAEIVRSHHEMFDGSGYPEGLRHDGVPLPARVFSVVDAFDAMTTTRPYRAALSVDYAAEEITRMAGTQFDPDVSRAFVALIDKLPVSPA